LEGKWTNDKNDYLAKEYSQTVSDTAKVEFDPVSLEHLNKELKVSSKAHFEPFFQQDEDVNYADASHWLRAVLNSFRNENDHYSFEFDGVKLSNKYTYELGNDWVFQDHGPTFEYATKFGRVVRTYNSFGSSIVVETKIEMPLQEISIA